MQPSPVRPRNRPNPATRQAPREASPGQNPPRYGRPGMMCSRPCSSHTTTLPATAAGNSERSPHNRKSPQLLYLIDRGLSRHRPRPQPLPHRRARQPRRQAVRQKADGRMALTAIPTRHLRAGRGLPRVGAVARHGTSAVRVIGAALEPCIAPRLGSNVFLAGKPRVVTKLHTGHGPAGLRPCGPLSPLSKARGYGPATRGAKPPGRGRRPGRFSHSPDIAGNPTTGQCEKRRRASIQLEGETTAGSMTGLSVMYAKEATGELEWAAIPDRNRAGRLREVYWARRAEACDILPPRHCVAQRRPVR